METKLLPISGLSDVMGIIDETVLRNIVRDRSMVTPEHKAYLIYLAQNYLQRIGNPHTPNQSLISYNTQPTSVLLTKPQNHGSKESS